MFGFCKIDSSPKSSPLSSLIQFSFRGKGKIRKTMIFRTKFNAMIYQLISVSFLFLHFVFQYELKVSIANASAFFDPTFRQQFWFVSYHEKKTKHYLKKGWKVLLNNQ